MKQLKNPGGFEKPWKRLKNPGGFEKPWKRLKTHGGFEKPWMKNHGGNITEHYKSLQMLENNFKPLRVFQGFSRVFQGFSNLRLVMFG